MAGKLGDEPNLTSLSSNTREAIRVRHTLPQNLRPSEAVEYKAVQEVELPGKQIKVLENVRANAQGQLFRRTKLLPESFGRVIDRNRYTRPRARAKFVVRSYLLCRTTEMSDCVWIVDNLSSYNYYHWLTECLPRLVIAVEGQDLPTRLLLPGSMDIGFVNESLAAFPEVTPVYIGRWSVAKIGRAALPSRLAPDQFHNPETIHAVASRLRRTFRWAADPDRAHERIYISRARDGRRHVSNEHEVTAMLSEYGFATVYPAEMTLAEQVSYASTARCMIGLHGAGLTNMMFMAPGGSVLEIREPSGFLAGLLLFHFGERMRITVLLCMWWVARRSARERLRRVRDRSSRGSRSRHRHSGVDSARDGARELISVWLLEGSSGTIRDGVAMRRMVRLLSGTAGSF